jgi:metallo-beta-lactamase family protein
LRVRFLGAAQEVTGSNYLVECGGRRIFVDCGIHQGRNEDERNRESPLVDPGKLDAVLLTHAHMDHSGRVPLLVRQGFKGKIWVTRTAVELLDVLWRDSAHLMKEEAEWKSRKNSRRGLPPAEPLYDEKDVSNTMALLQPVDYATPYEILPGMEACYYNAGHILGSASVALNLREPENEVRLVFSGDLGQQEAVVEPPPSVLDKAHYVLIESTYGDRLHRNLNQTRKEFREVITSALRDRGKVIIPSFVIDRAQRLLYELFLMQQDGLIPDDLPIFFDSPMGARATELYRQYSDTLSEDIQKCISDGQEPFRPKGLTFVTSAEQSRTINDVSSCIVIAGSGMCTGGRVVHHLKHAVWNPQNHVIFVGYQSYGTLGRRIVDGEKDLRIAGEDVTVRAQIHTLGGFSAHGDRDDLLAWAKHIGPNPLFFVVHGERKASHAFAASLQEAGMRSLVPMKNQELALSSEVVLRSGQPVAVPVQPLPEPQPAWKGDNEAVLAVDSIAKLLENLRVELKNAANASELMPLLVSTRTLLETMSNRAQKK